MIKGQLWIHIGKAAVLLLFGWLAGLSELSAQEETRSGWKRDTVYHKSGLTYPGRITDYVRGQTVALKNSVGYTNRFDLSNVDSIRWSDKSRLRYLDELVQLDSFPTIDVVYLKDGSIFRGEIVTYQRGGQLQFRIRSGILTVEDAEIEKIVQEPRDPLVLLALQQQKKPKVYAFRERGYYSTLSFGLLPGGGDYASEMGISLQAAFGYQFNRHLGAGLGVSLDGYAQAGAEDTFLPVFAELRGYLLPRNNTPYWVIAGGYGFPLPTESGNRELRRFDGGYLLYPSVGYRLGGSKSVNMTIDLGYKFQKAVTETEFFWSGEIITREVLYRRLSLRIGVVF